MIVASKVIRCNNDCTMDKLKTYLKANPIADDVKEAEVRRRLLPFVEQTLGPKEWILYDGNTVWDVKRLMKQFKVFVKDYSANKFTDYLYEFFHLQCGSIAHYNKFGWLSVYPGISSFKQFFNRNEYGERVKDYPPAWHYDARLATGQMHKILFTDLKNIEAEAFKKQTTSMNPWQFRHENK